MKLIIGCKNRRSFLVSPPSRGAWIEIAVEWLTKITLFSRPPRGGRGLKYWSKRFDSHKLPVAPLAGGVD